ncbi:MAG TPA: hypothetical protein PKX08_08125, partial [Cyclobacteriaceae bacterium]|nr:hypothetical protein [Cyclobacteriaceae bacterium]
FVSRDFSVQSQVIHIKLPVFSATLRVFQLRMLKFSSGVLEFLSLMPQFAMRRDVIKLQEAVSYFNLLVFTR